MTNRNEPYVIGLTGNIATGKSTVARMLRELGACVIDADRLAHWAMRAGGEVNRRIVERFGREVLLPDGEVDRARLAPSVFADASALRDLERIVHPVVVAETLRRIAACEQPVAVVEAIKLLEADMHKHCDAVWVVTSSRQQQIARLMHGRKMTASEAELRVDAQSPAEHKVAQADLVIDNDRGLSDTWAQVVRAWNSIPGIPRAPARPWQNHQKERAEPVSGIRAFLSQHPRLTSWIALSVGMVVLLLWAAWEKGLTASQLAGLVVATVGLAGACAWIIGWE